MDKILSIVIASYNVEAFLENTLCSCIPEDEQIQGRYEVLVINDGSRDGTLSIANSYAERYPRIFRVIDKPNGGYGSVINEGIRQARGKYFKLLDGDDWYDTQALEELVRRLGECDCDMVLTDYAVVHREGEAGRKVSICNGIRPDKIFCGEGLQALRCVWAMHGICYRTELLRGMPISFTEHCLYTDNEYAFYGMAFVKTAIYYPICLYRYRIGREGQSMSAAVIKNHAGDMERVIRDLETFYDSLGENGNRDLINFQIARAYRGYLSFLMLLPYSGEIRRKIMVFDRGVKERHPERYEWMGNRKIHILRATGYRAYGLCRFYCKWEKKRDER